MFASAWNLAFLENVVEGGTGRSREQQIWAYRLSEAATATVPAPSSNQKRAKPEPPLVEGLVVSVLGTEQVELHWPALPDLEGITYEVERAVVEVLSEDQLVRLKAQTDPLEHPSVGAIRRIGPFTQLTEQPISENRFLDTSLDLSRPEAIEGEPVHERRWHEDQLDPSGRAYRWSVYAYRVRAVNRDGVAGGWSAATLTIPSSPQFLFAKEAGTTCQLKWEPNPERGDIRYRVYRMNGRYSSDAIPRLTPDPIQETTFQDESVGEQTRRYHVVAVDVLGQEGFPSCPVWFQREWRRFYEPFTGEWHQ